MILFRYTNVHKSPSHHHHHPPLPMRYSMFQAMVRYDIVSLSELYEKLKDMNVTVKAFSPGSLGQCVKTSSHMIGSISVKCSGVSLLIFGNGKLKVSGGYQHYVASLCPIIIYLLDITERATSSIGLTIDLETFRIHLLNGMFSISDVFDQKNYFVNILPKLSNYYDNVKMPKCLSLDQPQKGRLCAVNIKTNEGSMQFDHKGNVQMFGFKNIEHLHEAKDKLRIVCKSIVDKC